MARVIDENLRRHWNLVLGTCIKYYPARLKVGSEQAADRGGTAYTVSRAKAARHPVTNLYGGGG